VLDAGPPTKCSSTPARALAGQHGDDDDLAQGACEATLQQREAPRGDLRIEPSSPAIASWRSTA
jgi:hypothetical protein